MNLEQGIDIWTDSAALGENHHYSDQEYHNDNWRKPPGFSFFEHPENLSEDVFIIVHIIYSITFFKIYLARAFPARWLASFDQCP